MVDWAGLSGTPPDVRAAFIGRPLFLGCELPPVVTTTLASRSSFTSYIHYMADEGTRKLSQV
jgi:hypothetical protein